MMSRMLLSAVGMVCCSWLCGCDAPFDDESGADTSMSEAEGGTDGVMWADVDCEASPVITYETFGRGFLSTYCDGCHGGQVALEARQGAPASAVFDSADQASAFADRILARTRGRGASVGTMPPSGGITPEDLERLDVWLTCYP